MATITAAARILKRTRLIRTAYRRSLGMRTSRGRTAFTAVRSCSTWSAFKTVTSLITEASVNITVTARSTARPWGDRSRFDGAHAIEVSGIGRRHTSRRGTRRRAIHHGRRARRPPLNLERVRRTGKAPAQVNLRARDCGGRQSGRDSPHAANHGAMLARRTGGTLLFCRSPHRPRHADAFSTALTAFSCEAPLNARSRLRRTYVAPRQLQCGFNDR